VNRTIGTLAAVVALTLAACGSGTASTTTTEDTRGWSDEAFRDLMTYCQAETSGDGCATFIIQLRDTGQCSVEATYRIIDDIEIFEDFVRDVLLPAGDCLGFDE